MVKRSAGLLIYRIVKEEPEVFLVHPGGPFWAKKDANAWSIPKGEFPDEEDALSAAIREFKEETGIEINGNFIPLNPIVQKNGKKVYAWALERDIDAEKVLSNTFEMEWPPKSGKLKSFPEIDRGGWFNIPEAKEKINSSQFGLIEELMEKLNHTV